MHTETSHRTARRTPRNSFMILALTLIVAACGGGGGGGGSGGDGTHYIVGGTVSGLTGAGLVLQNNGGSNLTVSASGAFTFPETLAAGSAYSVTVLTQPSGPAQTCTVANGAGTANANVTNVTVSCTTDDTDDDPNIIPVAVAGVALDVARDATVVLDGSGSSDADGDALTYTWTQTYGPDVTSGAGILTGATPSFIAPDNVSTVRFELVVNDGEADSAADSVQIDVMEAPDASVFVDGNSGSDDSGDGSRAAPFATISHALASLPAPGHDVYVMSVPGSYEEYGAPAADTISLTIPDGTSLYGGFGPSWVRDVVANGTRLSLRARGIRFAAVNHDAWLSGFTLGAADISAGIPSESFGISADAGTATLTVEHNTIASAHLAGLFNLLVGSSSSYGIRVSGLGGVRILHNRITAGAGGDGRAGVNGLTGSRGNDGASATGQSGAAETIDPQCPWGAIGAGNCTSLGSGPAWINPAVSGSYHLWGGAGGAGGIRSVLDAEARGANGASGYDDMDVFLGPTGSPGGPGGTRAAGAPGNGGHAGRGTAFVMGRGGAGGNGRGTIVDGVYADTATGGERAAHGGGGGGGGGGSGGIPVFGNVGGGGGAGGSGGIGGQGGTAGGGGGASIGVLIANIADALIRDNTIQSGNGGNGAAGGVGGGGGNGGNGGFGAGDWAGGNGGGGGKGGEGGQGGAGGGGPSYGVLVGTGIAPEISNNVIYTGNGGAPGADGAGAGGGAKGGRAGSPASGRLGATAYDLARPDGAPASGGWSYGIYDINPGDGLVPAAGGNTFFTGGPGSRGEAGTQNF